MKKIILLLGFAIISSAATVSYSPAVAYQEVFICDSKSGKKYHFSKTCRGLNACKASIKKLSLINATKGGKTICGWED